MKTLTLKQLEIGNALALFGSAMLVAMAFSMQIILSELPCALCNLQRLAFLLFGCGLLVVLIHPSRYRGGYLVSGIGAIVGACTAITQVFIHILPNDEGGVGSPILGFHLYAWCFVLFILAVVYTLVLQSLHPAVREERGEESVLQRYKRHPTAVRMSIAFYIFVSVIATSSAFVANGFGPFLEGGQQNYWLIEVVKHPGDTITKDMLMQKKN